MHTQIVGAAAAPARSAGRQQILRPQPLARSGGQEPHRRQRQSASFLGAPLQDGLLSLLDLRLRFIALAAIGDGEETVDGGKIEVRKRLTFLRDVGGL